MTIRSLLKPMSRSSVPPSPPAALVRDHCAPGASHRHASCSASASPRFQKACAPSRPRSAAAFWIAARRGCSRHEGEALARHTMAPFAAERTAEEELRALRRLQKGAAADRRRHDGDLHAPRHLGVFRRAYPAVELHVFNANTHRVDGPWLVDAMVLIAAPSRLLAAAAWPLRVGRFPGPARRIRRKGAWKAPRCRPVSRGGRDRSKRPAP